MTSPSEEMKDPVPPRPAAPTEHIASLRHWPSLLADVPSICDAGTRRPISRSMGSSAAVSVMGHARKRMLLEASLMLLLGC